MGRVMDVFGWISLAGAFFIMMLIVVDVFLRFSLNAPILGSYEIVERAMFCVIFASFAYAQTEKAHIRIDLLVGLFPEKLHLFVDFILLLLSAFMAAAIAYAAYLQSHTALSSGYTTSVLKIALYPFYWVECACMVAFAVTLLYDAAKNLIALFDKQTAEDVKAGWSTSDVNLSS